MYKNSEKQVAKLNLRLFLTQFGACYIILKNMEVFFSAVFGGIKLTKTLYGFRPFDHKMIFFGEKGQALVVFTEKCNGTGKDSYF